MVLDRITSISRTHAKVLHSFAASSCPPRDAMSGLLNYEPIAVFRVRNIDHSFLSRDTARAAFSLSSGALARTGRSPVKQILGLSGAEVAALELTPDDEAPHDAFEVAGKGHCATLRQSRAATARMLCHGRLAAFVQECRRVRRSKAFRSFTHIQVSVQIRSATPMLHYSLSCGFSLLLEAPAFHRNQRDCTSVSDRLPMEQAPP